MNDLLVLSSFEALRYEQLRLDRSEAELNEKLRLRGALLKREEVANRRQLTNLIIRVQMLQCENICLGFLLRGDRDNMKLIEHNYQLAISDSKRAANERKEYNAFVAQEIQRLSKLCQSDPSSPPSNTFPVFTSEAEKMDAVVHNYSQLTIVRTAADESTARHAEALRRLEDSARDGREKHMAAATELSRACYDLKGQIVTQRVELRQLYTPDHANGLVCWAESMGRTARAKARWDFMHPVCMLDVVMLEGLRLRVEEEMGVGQEKQQQQRF